MTGDLVSSLAMDVNGSKPARSEHQPNQPHFTTTPPSRFHTQNAPQTDTLVVKLKVCYLMNTMQHTLFSISHKVNTRSRASHCRRMKHATGVKIYSTHTPASKLTEHPRQHTRRLESRETDEQCQKPKSKARQSQRKIIDRGGISLDTLVRHPIRRALLQISI